mmetsp:Transcript_45773/g.127044  ORF Transcript_45773/g.127044 Transcript_45773/m.127044 type:complete len:91 (-) Transcript_45773:238-510(-)
MLHLPLANRRRSPTSCPCSRKRSPTNLLPQSLTQFDVLDGSIEFEVQAVNKDESEMSGVFVSAQPSDTDMGGKEAKKLLLKGVFYAKLDQ